jgi:hypothetical protein
VIVYLEVGIRLLNICVKGGGVRGGGSRVSESRLLSSASFLVVDKYRCHQGSE